MYCSQVETQVNKLILRCGMVVCMSILVLLITDFALRLGEADEKLEERQLVVVSPPRAYIFFVFFFLVKNALHFTLEEDKITKRN